MWRSLTQCVWGSECVPIHIVVILSITPFLHLFFEILALFLSCLYLFYKRDKKIMVYEQFEIFFGRSFKMLV